MFSLHFLTNIIWEGGDLIAPAVIDYSCNAIFTFRLEAENNDFKCFFVFLSHIFELQVSSIRIHLRQPQRSIHSCRPPCSSMNVMWTDTKFTSKNG